MHWQARRREDEPPPEALFGSFIVDDPFFSGALREIDRLLPTTASDDLPGLFQRVPLDLFAALLFDGSAHYSNIRSFLPRPPTPIQQKAWVGLSGFPLLRQSIAFVRSLDAAYQCHGSRPLAQSQVLDYGCGWGRILGLLLRYVPEGNLYGVDPDTTILDTARRLGVRGSLAQLIDPSTSLPFDLSFELIFAFSVFTHLSEMAQQRALALIERHLTDDGLLVVTVRPRAIWDLLSHERSRDLMQSYDKEGFAFEPHNRPLVEGEVPYGDASFDLDYIGRKWSGFEVVGTDYNLIDPGQIIVFLKKHR